MGQAERELVLRQPSVEMVEVATSAGRVMPSPATVVEDTLADTASVWVAGTAPSER